MGRRGMHVGYRWERQKERDSLKDIVMVRRIILK
jgi:hypothetical protein